MNNPGFERPITGMIVAGANPLTAHDFGPEGLPVAIISTLERSGGSISLDYTKAWGGEWFLDSLLHPVLTDGCGPM